MTSPRTLLRELMCHAASAGSIDDVYRAALHCVQYGLGIDRASLLLFDAAGSMRFVAWSGLSDEYRRAVDGHSPWSSDDTEAVPLLIEDVEGDASLASYLPFLRQEGIRALAFIPLQFGPRLLGKFMLYYRDRHRFSAEEIATAERIADFVVLSLEHHRLAVALKEQLLSERDLRHRAEVEAAQRQESESRLHVALAAGQMGAWDWDLTTGRIGWSAELERMHGLPSGTFTGDVQSLVNFVHPLDADRVARVLANVARLPESEYQLEYRILRADGACRWLACRGRLLVDGDGRPSRMVGVSCDITDLKHMAELASEADRRKDDFLATLAHELRNPLAAVRLAVAVMRKAKGDPDAVVEHCVVVDRQLRQLTRLVDDLLDVADITRRGLPLEKTRIELLDVVRVALEQVRVPVEEAGHELSVQLPVEPILLDADPERLVQVLVNLLTNAVKYTPRGGQIELTAEREGSEVRLSVSDSGLGIPTDKLDSVFEMFGQLDRSLETGYKGLGIGLALASALVTKHGGRIEAHSDGIGTGSEFTVWLPLASAPASDEPALEVARARAAAAPAVCRVLLVDDNQDLALATSNLLLRLGHDVRVALDGAEAITVAADFRPDVVLLDIAMPKVNGFEVARTLRQTSWGRAATLVAVTGWGRQHDHRRSTEAGFDRHMTKPVDPVVLEAFLDTVARRPRMTRHDLPTLELVADAPPISSHA